MEHFKYTKLEQGAETVKDVAFKIVDKNEKNKAAVMKLLHEYPDQFVPGLFEEMAKQDFADSDIMVAYQEDKPIGTLMYNRATNEYNWLAVHKGFKGSKAGIGRKLFESFYPTLKPGTKVHFFVNTEDASIPGNTSFSGKNFNAARKLYRSMGLEIKEENRMENKYGPGAHAYKVEWIIGENK